MGEHEPSADVRMGGQQIFSMFTSMVAAGMSERNACYIIGVMLGQAMSNGGDES